MKTPGRIILAEYGFGPTNENQELWGTERLEGEYVWGLTIHIATDSFSMMDFIGVTLSDYPTSFSRFIRRLDTSNYQIADILKAAKRTHISKLVGVRVIVEHESGKFLNWEVENDQQ